MENINKNSIKILVIIIIALLFNNSCNTSSKEEDVTKSLIHNDEYFKESQKVFSYSIDSLWVIDNRIVFDTICFFDVYDRKLIIEVLNTVDSTLSISIIQSMLSDFDEHKSDNIRKLLPRNKPILYAHIDSVGSNHELFFTYPKKYKGIYLFSAPLFDENYKRCLIYFISFTKAVSGGISGVKINGYFTYYEKMNGEWKYRSRIRAPERFNFAI